MHPGFLRYRLGQIPSPWGMDSVVLKYKIDDDINRCFLRREEDDAPATRAWSLLERQAPPQARACDVVNPPHIA